MHRCSIDPNSNVNSKQPPVLLILFPPSLPHTRLQEKHKYELITGQWKSTDDLISMYTELLTSQPGLMGYIDPLHHEVYTHS